MRHSASQLHAHQQNLTANLLYERKPKLYAEDALVPDDVHAVRKDQLKNLQERINRS